MIYSLADAIGGVCSDCHTMHDSQNNADQGATGPQEQLLLDDCIGCHSGTIADGNLNSLGAPVVYRTDGAPATYNAAGDFRFSAAGGGGTNAQGHNISGVPGHTAIDPDIGINPPGWDASVTTGTSVTWGADSMDVTGAAADFTGVGLTCAGTFGCHGTHAATGNFGILALSGAHHDNAGFTDKVTSRTAPSGVASSYRFLADIYGEEHGTHEYSGTSNQLHNQYAGDDINAAGNRDGSPGTYTRTTISYMCAQCHGLFHNTIDGDATAGSPWIRHPNDIALLATGETALYNTTDGTNIGTYDLTVPIARDVGAAFPTAAARATVTAGTDIVMCLSCHRAHASPYPDALRFDYTPMIAGGGNSGGCFVCHTAKNDSVTHP
jgi:hypothetical protein